MRAWPVALVALAALAGATSPRSLTAQQPVVELEETDEAFFSIRYADIVNTIVTGRYFADSLYIPVGALLESLRIHYVLDPQNRRIGGFIVDPDSSYSIDLPAGVATFGDRRIPLPDSSFIPSDIEIYALPGALEAIFGFRFVVDLRNLIVRVSSATPLPVADAVERELRRARIESAELIQPDAPLRYARERALFGGGLLQYAFTAARVGSSFDYTADLAAGGEVAGGDIQGRMLAARTDGQLDVLDTDLRWRYVYGEDRWLNQIAVGTSFSNGLQPVEYHGLRLTNAPVRPRDRLGAHLVTGATEPGWEVELYVGGQLIGFTQADAQGHFALTMPLVYGTSLITLRFYGPGGQIVVEDRRVEVPFEFVPEGRLDYVIDAGRTARDRYSLLHGGAVYGIRDWLSARGGLEYLGAPQASEPTPFLGVSARLRRNVIADLEAAPGAYVRVDAEASPTPNSSYGFSYTRTAGESFYFPSDLQHQLRVRAFAPADLWVANGSLRLVGEARWFDNGFVTYNTELAAVANIPNLKPSLAYRRIGIVRNGDDLLGAEEISAGALYRVPAMRERFDWLNGTLVVGQAGYQLNGGGLGRISLEASRTLLRDGRIAVGFEHDPISEDTRFSIRYFFDGPLVRSGLTVQQRSQETFTSGYVRGAVAYDPLRQRPLFSGREWLGSSAASIRLFVDRDNNGRYGAGEPLIDPNAIRFRRSIATVIGADSVLRTADLQAYNRYSVEIDQGRIKNPLWVPRFENFSFETDPNGYKRVDVPFYTAGVVEGTVLRRVGDALQPLSGVRVRLRSLDGRADVTVPTFSDGSYYHMGLPPGRYEASVDPGQLAILSAVAAPVSFEVDATAEGDFVEGIDIVLEPGTENLPQPTGAH